MPRAKPRGKIPRVGTRASPRKRNTEAMEINNEGDNKNEDVKLNDEEFDDDSGGKGSGDTSQSDTNEPTDSKSDDDGPKKRGRKRKSEGTQEEKPVPAQDSTPRGIMAQGGSLRRRDTLKSSWRYSPPPVTRRSKVEENKSAKVDRKKPAILKSQPTSQPQSKSDATNDNNKMVVNMPDGFQLKVEPPKKKIAVTPAKPKTVVIVDTPTTKTTNKDSSTKDSVEDTATDDVTTTIDKKNDKESDKNAATNNGTEQQLQAVKGTRVSTRRKSTETVATASTTTTVTTPVTNTVTVTEKSKSPVRVAITSVSAEKTSSVSRSLSTMHHPIGMSKTQTITISTNTQPVTVTTTTKNQVTNSSSNCSVTSNSTSATTTTTTTSSSTTTTTLSTVTNAKTSGTIKVPTILKPTITTLATNVSNVSKGPPIKKHVSLSKYLDTLPEIEDCIHNDEIQDSHMEKLPDKILLVHSELPLPLAIWVDKEDENYLFRQIISPVNSTRYVCLLCKGIDVNFGTKEEKDILLHYQSLHELDVDIGHAKFSEDIVFICLPKMILNQFSNSTSLSLNSPCQYCDTRLSNIGEMKEHYSQEHNKEVIMMEQEEIMQMHKYFYCSKCKEQSYDFDVHHRHMKTKHNLKTYRCKSCVLVTRDENRLRTHFKAKHMLHSSGQNYQCYYCHGLLIGVERLQKHIQQSHMVQTGPSNYSCVACRQSCGKGKELLSHAQNCAVAGLKPEKSDLRYVPNLDCSPLSEGECYCYFCNARLENQDAYDLHLHHEHKQWLPIETATENKINNLDDSNNFNSLLTINDVVSDDDLKRAQIKTYVGHWCRICDQMVKVYQLYYLHMVNHHKMEKMFQCIISECKMTFRNFDEFKHHINESGHSQKTIISHPDEVFVCAYCDIYFSNDDELISHLITDQHINKFTASGHFHRTEPRNFKCKACHTFFGMKESYVHHLETESHQYVCTYCGITTATPSSRRAHIQNSHAEKLLLCEDCGECQSDIMAHFVLHGYTFECKKCVKKFYNRERLNAHMEVHQDPIQCNWSDCDRMIATRSMLVTHYRGHKSEHKCSVCGQAFWNFSMLTSHLRSHQPMPRNPHVISKTNQMGRATVQYQNQSRPSPSVLRSKSSTPMLSNSVIKCGHCNNLFRSTKDLSLHKCTPKYQNNGDQNKLLELASKATAQAKVGTSSANKTPTRRRASPKKPQPIEQQILDLPAFHGQQPVDDDTQLIMILNQSTGELMEITAPRGMEVQDVINSLNFNQPVEDVQMEVIDDQTQQTAFANIVDVAQQEQQESNNEITKQQEAKIVPTTEQEETAAAIEVIEQVNDQTTSTVHVNEENQQAETSNNHEVVLATNPGTETTTTVLIQQDGDDPQVSHQIIETDDPTGSQAIVLPPECINEDGSLILDAETLQRLNLAISVDENGTITTQDGSTTFIIDTSKE